MILLMTRKWAIEFLNFIEGKVGLLQIGILMAQQTTRQRPFGFRLALLVLLLEPGKTRILSLLRSPLPLAISR